MQASSTCTAHGTDGAMRSWSTTLDSSAWARAPSPRSTIAAHVPIAAAKGCVHSLRGLHATLATEAGVSSHAVASALGHTAPAVTHAHYIQAGTKHNDFSFVRAELFPLVVISAARARG